MTTIDRKDYLKKYLSKKTDKKKKKRKVAKGSHNRVTIIDDNVDVYETIQDIQNENEDAPQIVAVYDERPVDLRLQQFKDRSAWTISELKPVIKIEQEDSPHSEGNTPPRRSTQPQDNDSSPPRRRPDHNDPHLIKNEDETSLEQSTQRQDNDSSPPRRKTDDQSPRRRSKVATYEDDCNPSRRARRDTDSSPQRRRSRDARNSRNHSPRRSKSNQNSRSSPLRAHQEEDHSPPRKRQQNDRSLEYKEKSQSVSHSKCSLISEDTRIESSSLISSSNRETRWGPKESSGKAIKMLDGKTAGLQNARDMIRETENLKKREDKLFAEIPADVSGAMAQTIIRDRNTGRVRNLEEEAKEKSEQQKRRQEVQKMYDKWGKGMKQVNDYKDKLKQDAYEMNKPLARYADDADLERRQKEEERDGDPMLAYIRQKKRDKVVAVGVKTQPGYQGNFLPNRFGIRPGHRWDGVSRSNGYEKRWFAAFNERNAQREYSYKWNTEDM